MIAHLKQIAAYAEALTRLRNDIRRALKRSAWDTGCANLPMNLVNVRPRSTRNCIILAGAIVCRVVNAMNEIRRA